ncbi:MAG: TetR/AcrR family transcriptional regulator [Candidatus Marinimicrobia bacterium]|nr:TetR/AcrR family transcriptional regulator [Candidatus Neomarinimicrobiota bacterium]
MTPLPKDEEKRKRIITAAIQVFAHDGLSNGKIATIAEKAGIGKGTVYEYFNSKEDIFAAVFHNFFDQLMTGYLPLIEAPMDPKQKIEAIIDFIYDSMEQLLQSRQSQKWLIFMEILLHGFRDSIRGSDKLVLGKALRDIYDIFKPIIEEGIRSANFRQLDPDYLTFIIFTTLDGLALHYFMNHDYYDTEKLKEITKEFFLRGILQPIQERGD